MNKYGSTRESLSDMPKKIYQVFNIAYTGISRDLSTEVEIVDPISGNSELLPRAIWDTGATNSVINNGIALKLGLAPTGQSTVNTANGRAIVNTYVINLLLPHSKIGILALNVSEGNLGAKTDMLIGMDVISIGDFTVQNYDGKTHFSFAVPPFENKYDMVEKADKLNSKVLKNTLRHD